VQVALLLQLLQDSTDFDAAEVEGLSPAEYRQVGSASVLSLDLLRIEYPTRAPAPADLARQTP